jgi:hypothetical protein
MTSAKLSKHYGALAPAERLALLLAAGARNDDVEHARLTGSAPCVTWQVPDTFGRALALLVVSSQHRMKLLELAALFFRTRALASEMDGTSAKRMASVAGVYGYLFRAHAEGWTRFCEDEGLDPTVCERAAPGADVLKLAHQEADAFGFTEPQARAFLTGEGETGPESLLTPRTVELQLREGYGELMTQWA